MYDEIAETGKAVRESRASQIYGSVNHLIMAIKSLERIIKNFQGNEVVEAAGVETKADRKMVPPIAEVIDIAPGKLTDAAERIHKCISELEDMFG